MPHPSRYWSDLSTREFAQIDLARTIAVLPVAATEQHGPHLPVSVDADLVDGVIEACLPHLTPELSVLFLPTQKVGFSPEHQAFHGTLTLSATTVIRLWTELGESVARAGVRKLVLLNSHGGQVGLTDPVARDLRARLGLMVYSVQTFALDLGPQAGQLIDADEQRYGIHAGQSETSMMLALRPERVAMQHAEEFESASRQRAQHFPTLGDGRSARLAWQIQDVNPSGAVGNAAAASAGQGRALLEATGRALARVLTELDRLPAQTLVAGPLS